MRKISSTKQFPLILIMLICMITWTSCHEEEDIVEVEHPMAVTYNNLAGTWELVQYYGQPLPQGEYLRLTFDRKEKTVELRSNIDSQNERVQTSTFTLSGDSYYGYVISGSYGPVAGDWTHSYYVQLFTSGKMIWTATSNPNYIQVFKKTKSDYN